MPTFSDFFSISLDRVEVMSPSAIRAFLKKYLALSRALASDTGIPSTHSKLLNHRDLAFGDAHPSGVLNVEPISVVKAIFDKYATTTIGEKKFDPSDEDLVFRLLASFDADADVIDDGLPPFYASHGIDEFGFLTMPSPLVDGYSIVYTSHSIVAVMACVNDGIIIENEDIVIRRDGLYLFVGDASIPISENGIIAVSQYDGDLRVTTDSSDDVFARSYRLLQWNTKTISSLMIMKAVTASTLARIHANLHHYGVFL